MSLRCSQKIENKKVQEKCDSFELERDFDNFSTALGNDDSLILIVNASICVWSEMDRLVFIKKDGNVRFNTTVHIWMENEEIHKLGTVEYTKATDSLNFENLFKFVSDKGISRQGVNSSVFTLIHGKDTLRLYSDHLLDHMENLGYFANIQRRFYPDAEMYNTVLEPTEE
ncbi:MAG: hypothetical protein NXI10_13230 [bacterium]|nr:hypothetical protein [bacterium]